MSFLKKLFGLGGGAAAPAAPAPAFEYKGFLIRATPVAEGGEWRVSGVVVELGEGGRELPFQRADRMSSKDECVEITFQKGRQIIDDHRGRPFG